MREISSSESEVLRAVAAVIKTDPFGIEEAIRGVLALQVDRPEWAFLRHEQLFITTNLSQAATGAGNFSAIALVNRVSNSLVVVRGFHVTGAAVLFKHSDLPNAAFEAALNSEAPAFPLDLRYIRPGVAEASVAARIVALDTVAGAFAATPFGVSFGAGPAFADAFPPAGLGPLAILPPQSLVLAEATLANTAVSGFFYGYVKPLTRGVRA